MALATVLPGSQVAKRLRLRLTDLKKQSLARPTSLPTAAASPDPGFIEVPAPWLGSAVPGAALIEVERPEGARLRLHYRTAPPPLAMLLRAFLEPA